MVAEAEVARVERPAEHDERLPVSLVEELVLPVADLDQFKKDYLQFRKDHPRDPVVLEVSKQDGREETINIEPPQNDANGAGGTPP